MDKELEKELKTLMEEVKGYINTKMGAMEKSVLKYADKKLAK